MPKINQSRSLFVVGDDAQSIYGFRGSKVEIILNFTREYPQAKEIILNQNYRSTQRILNLAEEILSHNQYRKKSNYLPKTLRKLRLFTTKPLRKKTKPSLLLNDYTNYMWLPKLSPKNPDSQLKP